MSRRIRVKAIRREKPDVSLYVRALLAMAHEMHEADQQPAKSSDPVRPESASEADHA